VWTREETTVTEDRKNEDGSSSPVTTKTTTITRVKGTNLAGWTRGWKEWRDNGTQRVLGPLVIHTKLSQKQEAPEPEAPVDTVSFDTSRWNEEELKQAAHLSAKAAVKP
jgi:hypothetical protein